MPNAPKDESEEKDSSVCDDDGGGGALYECAIGWEESPPSRSDSLCLCRGAGFLAGGVGGGGAPKP